MARSTKAEKAQHLNAARVLLQRHVALPEAVRRLSRQFDLSERQAYRYRSATEEREKQWTDHWSNRDRRVECVSTHSKKAWLSRVQKTAHFKSMFPIRLIACSSRSSLRPTIFWCPVASAPSACA